MLQSMDEEEEQEIFGPTYRGKSFTQPSLQSPDRFEPRPVQRKIYKSTNVVLLPLVCIFIFGIIVAIVLLSTQSSSPVHSSGNGHVTPVNLRHSTVHDQDGVSSGNGHHDGNGQHETPDHRHSLPIHPSSSSESSDRYHRIQGDSSSSSSSSSSSEDKDKKTSICNFYQHCHKKGFTDECGRGHVCILETIFAHSPLDSSSSLLKEENQDENESSEDEDEDDGENKKYNEKKTRKRIKCYFSHPFPSGTMCGQGLGSCDGSGHCLVPTRAPTFNPTSQPSRSPSAAPTIAPTTAPSATPTTARPTVAVTPLPPGMTDAPTALPTTAQPTALPTTARPTTAAPTSIPTFKPTFATAPPLTRQPTFAPTPAPTRPHRCEPPLRLDACGVCTNAVSPITTCPWCYAQDVAHVNTLLTSSSSSSSSSTNEQRGGGGNGDHSSVSETERQFGEDLTVREKESDVYCMVAGLHHVVYATQHKIIRARASDMQPVESLDVRTDLTDVQLARLTFACLRLRDGRALFFAKRSHFPGDGFWAFTVDPDDLHNAHGRISVPITFSEPLYHDLTSAAVLHQPSEKDSSDPELYLGELTSTYRYDAPDDVYESSSSSVLDDTASQGTSTLFQVLGEEKRRTLLYVGSGAAAAASARCNFGGKFLTETEHGHCAEIILVDLEQGRRLASAKLAGVETWNALFQRDRLQTTPLHRPSSVGEAYPEVTTVRIVRNTDGKQRLLVVDSNFIYNFNLELQTISSSSSSSSSFSSSVSSSEKHPYNHLFYKVRQQGLIAFPAPWRLSHDSTCVLSAKQPQKQTQFVHYDAEQSAFAVMHFDRASLRKNLIASGNPPNAHSAGQCVHTPVNITVFVLHQKNGATVITTLSSANTILTSNVIVGALPGFDNSDKSGGNYGTNGFVGETSSYATSSSVPVVRAHTKGRIVYLDSFVSGLKPLRFSVETMDGLVRGVQLLRRSANEAVCGPAPKPSRAFLGLIDQHDSSSSSSSNDYSTTSSSSSSVSELVHGTVLKIRHWLRETQKLIESIPSSSSAFSSYPENGQAHLSDISTTGKQAHRRKSVVRTYRNIVGKLLQQCAELVYQVHASSDDDDDDNDNDEGKKEKTFDPRRDIVVNGNGEENGKEVAEFIQFLLDKKEDKKFFLGNSNDESSARRNEKGEKLALFLQFIARRLRSFYPLENISNRQTALYHVISALGVIREWLHHFSDSSSTHSHSSGPPEESVIWITESSSSSGKHGTETIYIDPITNQTYTIVWVNDHSYTSSSLFSDENSDDLLLTNSRETENTDNGQKKVIWIDGTSNSGDESSITHDGHRHDENENDESSVIWEEESFSREDHTEETDNSNEDVIWGDGFYNKEISFTTDTTTTTSSGSHKRVIWVDE